MKNENSVMNQTVALSRAVARAFCPWDNIQKKIFVMMLTKIRWTEENNNNIVFLEKEEMMKALDLNMTTRDFAKLLKGEMTSMVKSAYLTWRPRDDDLGFGGGMIITTYEYRNGLLTIEINKNFMPHLEGFVKANGDSVVPFLTFWSNDVYALKQKHSLKLYEELRTYGNTARTELDPCQRDYTTKQLKTLLGLDEEAYMRGKKTGDKTAGFDRTNFERKCLTISLAEINQKTKLIKILPDPTTKQLFTKMKQDGHIHYIIRWIVKDPKYNQKKNGLDGFDVNLIHLPD
jgi:hypothetical protein